MYRKYIALILLVFTAIGLFFYTNRHGSILFFISTESEAVTEAVFTPVTETYSITNSDTYDFISFQSDHVIDIEPILQNPDFPTGCEIVSLTMVLSYITQETVDTNVLVDDYITLYSDNFATGFMGDPRSVDGGGTFPPAIAKCANDYLTDAHINLIALDATGIELKQILNYIDAGFPIIMWTTIAMKEPSWRENFAEYGSTTYQWYISEHCVLVKGYDLEKNVFIINDPMVGEVERDIDEFMEISDAINNLAVLIL